jgi:metallo-beta-lactamase family protein
MTITFYGAAGSVTGSKHLIEAAGKRILLDCGTFQGLPDMKERNRSLAFGPDTVDAVIISHAHLDHCGMLPLLVKRGYKGPIYCTPATRDVMEYMLLDAAHIEVQDAEYRAKHKLDSPDERVPLFTPEDIPAVMNRILTVPYFRVSKAWFEVDGVRFKFYEAGHILGSAVTVLEVDESDGKKRLAFTGDLGPAKMPLLRDPEVPTEEISTLLLESTYGGREHAPLEEAYGKLVKFINEVVARKGKIIVPAFSLGRTQMLVYIIHKLTDEGKIPRFPIYVDSPLAGHITEIYEKYKEEYDAETAADFKRHGDEPLAFRNLTYVQTVDESKKLNFLPGPFMIIASSGMMTGGRVIHHLRHNISDARNAIFITGYQAEGTLGRRLLEGVKFLDLYGQRLPVNASIEVFNEFSAHADGRELQVYAEAIKGLKRVYLVHGEPVQADVLQQHLAAVHPDWLVRRVREGEMATV